MERKQGEPRRAVKRCGESAHRRRRINRTAIHHGFGVCLALGHRLLLPTLVTIFSSPACVLRSYSICHCVFTCLSAWLEPVIVCLLPSVARTAAATSCLVDFLVSCKLGPFPPSFRGREWHAAEMLSRGRDLRCRWQEKGPRNSRDVETAVRRDQHRVNKGETMFGAIVMLVSEEGAGRVGVASAPEDDE